jgi:hypothetical protein
MEVVGWDCGVEKGVECFGGVGDSVVFVKVCDEEV